MLDINKWLTSELFSLPGDVASSQRRCPCCQVCEHLARLWHKFRIGRGFFKQATNERQVRAASGSKRNERES